MIVELGHFALVLALATALVQVALPAWGAHTRDDRLMATAQPAALAQLLLIALSFAALTWAYVTSDFTVEVVWANSHTHKPLLYKISGVWGNHEGSMLLWVLILALFGAAVALFGSNLPASLRARVLSVQALVAVAFLVFIIFASNPFLRIPPQVEGRGLNPILQDPALSLHPPILYAGYVGLSMAFSFAIAALIEGRIDAAWARWVRPWTLAAWMCLTLGIALGSWWAYYELGWGGWWAWDPVENASFMPWLAATALLHSALVMEKREALKVWTILLAILAFSLSLIGTFLVRSGVLLSVHAFAVDPRRGVFILAILVILIGGALALYAWRAPQLRQGGLFAPISREGALVFNNALLTVACGTVAVGTLYPLLLQAFDITVSVGPPYFNLTFGPLMVVLLAAMPLGPLLAWKRGDLLAVAQRLIVAAGLSVLALVVSLAIHRRGPWLAPFGIALGVWVVLGALTEWALRVKLIGGAPADTWRRAAGLPRAAYGTLLAHVGIGLTAIGIVATSAWQSETIVPMKPGDVTEIAGYRLTFRGVAPEQGPNYRAQVGLLTVARGAGATLTELSPARRLYDAPRQGTTEAAIYPSWRGDLYAVLGDELKDARGWVVRVYFNPLVRLIWIGAMVMALGGLVSLSDRRLRIGAPRRARRRPAPAATPAE